MEVDPPKELLKPLEIPQKILMGPGPSNCSQRVLRSLEHQVIGHLHPEMFKVFIESKNINKKKEKKQERKEK